MTDLLILCPSRGRRTSSAILANSLREQGLRVIRATPARPPRNRRIIHRVPIALSYGVSSWPAWMQELPVDCYWLNDPFTVSLCSNKLETFQTLSLAEVPTLEYTASREVARRWVEDDEQTVVSRTLLRASQGRGIVLSPPDPLPRAPLYTKLFRGRNVREYRVYIVDGVAVDMTQKRRWARDRREEAGVDHQNIYHSRIRNHANGWAFCRSMTGVSDEAAAALMSLAEDCAEACRIGYGAVDIISTHTKSGELIDARIVEPNSAPSLRGDSTTARIMSNAVASAVRILR